MADAPAGYLTPQNATADAIKPHLSAVVSVIGEAVVKIKALGGCSDTVYQVIEPNQRTKYRDLLQTKDLVDQHPRQKSRNMILGMKPYWGQGGGSFHWIQNDYLQGEQEPIVKEDGVVVGIYEDVDSDPE